PLALHDTAVQLIIEAGKLYLSYGKGESFGTVVDIVHMLSAYQCLSYSIYLFARLHRHVPNRNSVAPNLTNTQSANTVSISEKPPCVKKLSIPMERLEERRNSSRS
ncbi:hypothetical protein PENTCL1PPCAC_27656, partial [Pristionchus entomophagus]